jgi:hypothetical protein
MSAALSPALYLAPIVSFPEFESSRRPPAVRNLHEKPEDVVILIHDVTSSNSHLR